MNGLFGINGLSGYFLSVVILLAIVFGLGYAAVITQKEQANNPYVIEDINTLQGVSKDNVLHYKDAKEGKQ
ncbi:DUF4006 family protein [Helicobacter sp.]|uniref:DUF4006 family protein n=1 Tax=Helicobacter sp. TaxID=218 RepID=UPI0025BC6004|nr:DUF4006 family protein [Helicobacter sp.]MCI5967976.1 DUF4006 family protein [Helicobacter sp.]MDY2585091.1 DUF4006 family protein [Helicobacter sp.]